MAELEGKTLGRYRLRGIVGRGGMANVYEGYDMHLERKVAVKVFKRDNEELLRRFIREARVMDSLSNAHLVPVYDAGESMIDGMLWYYIVMPLMEGGTLRNRIRRAPLTLAQVYHYLRDIADALHYIHSQGIIHRDIKSSNILLDAQGRCYLTDFGIARLTTDETQLTSTGLVLGTVDYIAPELFEPHTKASVSSDLYALGVLLYEMVTGRLPFSADSQVALVTMHMTQPPPPPSSINGNVSPQVERVMLKALAKQPALRYASAIELAQAFYRAVAGTASPLAVPASPRPVVREIPSPVYSAGARSRTPVSLPSTASPPQRPRISLPPAPPEPPPHRSPVVAIVGFIVVLLLTVPMIYFLLPRGGNSSNPPATASAHTATSLADQTATATPTPTPNLTATAQAALAATATAQARATATVVAGVTATAQAKVTATAGVLQTATAVQPVYQDPLNNASNPSTIAANWEQNGNCAFATDGYHAKQNPGFLSSLHGCRESAHTYQNATITVDIVLVSGHSGGFFFRFSPDFFGRYSGYLFEIDSAGNYKISVFHNGTQTTLQDWTASSALNKGYNVKNTLQVIAKASTYLFYVNGIFLQQVVDGTLASGNIALLASAADANTEAVYSKLSVYPA